MDHNFKRQIKNDYSVSSDKFNSKENIFTLNKRDESFLFYDRADFSMICTRGKIFMRTDRPKLLDDLRKIYKNYPGAWFAEAANIRKLDRILGKYNIEIDNFFPLMSFSDREVLVKDFEFTRINRDVIYNFRNKTKMAFSFDEDDRFGLRYKDGNKLIALVGASVCGKYLRDIGLEKFSFENKYKGLAASILRSLSLIIREENEDISPIVATQFSHIQSINAALRAGYDMNFCLTGNEK